MAADDSINGDVIFRSKLPDIEIPGDLPLHTYCFQKLPQRASLTCLIDCANDRHYTYADVELSCRRVAAGLHRIGVRKGDVIMLLLPNSPEFIFAFLGASMRGAVVTAANPLHTAAEVEKHAKAAGAGVLITRACDVGKAKEMSSEGMKIVCVDAPPHGCTAFADLMAEEKIEPPEVEICSDDVVVLPFSSGTTGLPKGVMLSHRSNVTSIAQQIDGDNPNLYFREDDVMLCVLPLFHIYSLNITLCALRAGSAVAIMQRFEIKAVLEVLQKYRVTLAPVVPPIVLAIAKSAEAENYDLSSVRIVQCGAAPIGKELEDSVSSKFPNAKFGQGYGMTEAGPVLAMSLGFAKEPFEMKMGACGTVVRNSEMKIVDPETGVSLQRNQAGEICIRGDQVMKGYLNDPEATLRTIDKDRWLHTGDIGYVDDDDELFIVDRLKEIIKYKGFQVAPAEIENILVSHPLILDVAVIGMKDEAAGELPIAFVVKIKGGDISEDELKQFVSKQVVFYKRIHKVHFVDVIPKAPTGKILRKDLRKRMDLETPS